MYKVVNTMNTNTSGCSRQFMCLIILTTVAIFWLFYLFGHFTNISTPMYVCTDGSCVSQMDDRVADRQYRKDESRVSTEGSNDSNEIRSTNQQHETSKVNSTELEAAFRRYYKYFYNDYLPENIMDMKPIKFDPSYKNPCWYGASDNGPLNDNKLHCLPYFYIIGVKKSGTSDLYKRIIRHPDVTSQEKEPAWFPTIRWNYVTGMNKRKIPKILGSDVDHRTVGFYVKYFFDKTAQTIQSHPSVDSNTTKYNMITFDATPGNLMHNGIWTQLPGNEGRTEPRYTNLHYINHLTPNTKIIILFRDPVTRLFSDFLHVTYHYDVNSMTSEIFHDHVTQLTDAYKDCFSRWSMRRCIYNESIRLDFMKRGILLADSFIAGFLAFYMKELLTVFGRERIHTILTMEYEHNMENVLNKTFEFLNLSPLQQSELKAIVKQGKANAKNEKRRKVGPMLNQTRDMLYNFYGPYNREMTDLLNDSRYLFLKPTH